MAIVTEDLIKSKIRKYGLAIHCRELFVRDLSFERSDYLCNYNGDYLVVVINRSSMMYSSGKSISTQPVEITSPIYKMEDQDDFDALESFVRSKIHKNENQKIKVYLLTELKEGMIWKR